MTLPELEEAQLDSKNPITPIKGLVEVFICGLRKRGKRVEYAHCSPGVWALLGQDIIADQRLLYMKEDFHGSHCWIIADVSIVLDPWFPDKIIGFFPSHDALLNLTTVVL